MARVRHIVMLSLKDEFSAAEKKTHAERLKAQLEALKKIIPGIVTFTVWIDPLSTSNVDVAFDSTFVSESALSEYQTHPEHVKVVEYVKTIKKDRTCIDVLVDE